MVQFRARFVATETDFLRRDASVRQAKEDTAVGSVDLTIKQVEDSGPSGNGPVRVGRPIQVERHERFWGAVSHEVNHVCADRCARAIPGLHALFDGQLPFALLEYNVIGRAEVAHGSPFGGAMIVDCTVVTDFPGHHHQLESSRGEDQLAAVSILHRVVKTRPRSKIQRVQRHGFETASSGTCILWRSGEELVNELAEPGRQPFMNCGEASQSTDAVKGLLSGHTDSRDTLDGDRVERLLRLNQNTRNWDKN